MICYSDFPSAARAASPRHARLNDHVSEGNRACGRVGKIWREQMAHAQENQPAGSQSWRSYIVTNGNEMAAASILV